MSILSGTPKTQSKSQTAVTGLQVQTSAYGKAITLAYGTIRLAPNLIWYGNFFAIAHSSNAGGAGKGGGSASGDTSYTYFVSVALGLCHGPINGFGAAWSDKNYYASFGPSSYTNAGGATTYQSAFNGAFNQAAWGFLQTFFPGQALAYPGIAYVGLEQFYLGSDTSLPQFAYEVYALESNSVSGSPDADPSLVITDFLTNPNHGAGFPVSMLGDFTTYQNYALSAGLLVSFALDTQTSGATVLKDLIAATNSEFVWSQGKLNIVPYGDEAISGNGKSYTPPSTPLYDLTDDDFQPQSNVDPVSIDRRRPSDAYNSFQLEYLDRTSNYDVDVAIAQDQASIDLYGLRVAPAGGTHVFADAAIAQLSARLQLQRSQIRNIYTFTTDERYIGLDPMDIVTISDSFLGLNRQWVRIMEIDLNTDGTLTFTAEEYLAGTGHAPAYSFEPSAGYTQDYNVDPGDANAPVIFEAPVQIATSGLETWMAVSGGADWGGCTVWISSDGDTYKQAGRILGKARQGVLTASLATGADPDTAHTLSVDLTESAGALSSGTQSDADLGHTLCYVDGELISFETATLTSTAHYDLTYLRRGMYGTAVASHASSSQFARLDQAIFVYPYDKGQIGQTIYIKLVSFNIYGSGTQSLADVDPYDHVIQGPPPPSNVQNFLVAQNGNAVNFTWSQVPDFALAGYDIGYAPEGTTNWTLFSLLTEASKGTEMTNASVPAGTWTFGIRARDIADQLSPSISTFDLAVTDNNDTTTVQVQEPGWQGSMTGFIRHWTGVLIPDSTTLANNYSDFTIFNAFVTDPVATASYTTPTYDIGYEDALRVHSAYALTEGPGQTGSPTADVQLDSWVSGSDPGTYVDWTVGTIDLRYLNMKIIYNPTAGAVAYLSDFTYTVDRSPAIEQSQSIVVSAGGAAITFPQPFHDVPFVNVTVQSSSALYATAASVTTTGCTIHVWDHTGTDVGGTVSFTATGV